MPTDKPRTVLFAAGLGILVGCAVVAACASMISRGLRPAPAGARRQLEQSADFVQRVGEIRDLRLDRPPAPDDQEDDIWTYEVAGTKWSGRLRVKHETAADGSERIL